jgi:hypothetical protein
MVSVSAGDPQKVARAQNLSVANRGKGGSEVVVHLSFGERSVELEMQ